VPMELPRLLRELPLLPREARGVPVARDVPVRGVPWAAAPPERSLPQREGTWPWALCPLGRDCLLLGLRFSANASHLPGVARTSCR
jgi:hypothetical protein